MDCKQEDFTSKEFNDQGKNIFKYNEYYYMVSTYNDILNDINDFIGDGNIIFMEYQIFGLQL